MSWSLCKNELVTLQAGQKMVFIDEFSISTRPSTHYMWGQKGRQPQVPSDEKNRCRHRGELDTYSQVGPQV